MPGPFSTMLALLEKSAGPYIGPRGGLWADPKHKIHWGDRKRKKKRDKRKDDRKRAPKKAAHKPVQLDMWSHGHHERHAGGEKEPPKAQARPAPAPGAAKPKATGSYRGGNKGKGARILSLFSGFGGLDLGLTRALPQSEHTGYAENNTDAQRVLRRHDATTPIHDDVRDVARAAEAGTLDRPNVVVGGFPCQDLSKIGRGKGLAGKRSGMYREMLRVVQATKPDFAVYENAPELRRKGLNRVLADADDLGYAVHFDGVPASAVGAPHMRDRIFVVLHRPDVAFKFAKPDRDLGEHWRKEAPPKLRGRLPDKAEHDAQHRGIGNAVVPQVGEHVGRLIERAKPGPAVPAGSKVLATREGEQWISAKTGKPLDTFPRAGIVHEGKLYQAETAAPKNTPFEPGDRVWVRNPNDGLDWNESGWSYDGSGGVDDEHAGQVEMLHYHGKQQDGDMIDVRLPNGDVEPFDVSYISRYPTPTASEGKGGLADHGDTPQADSRYGRRKRGGQLRHWVQGHVNPEFSRWAMGFPEGHAGQGVSKGGRYVREDELRAYADRADNAAFLGMDSGRAERLERELEQALGQTQADRDAWEETKRQRRQGRTHVPQHGASRPVVGPPTKQRKRFPFQGACVFQGIKIDIENLQGSYREGTAEDGRKWRTYMRFAYGELRGTEGMDGDALDAYIGPDGDSPLVVVVHQQDPKTKRPDEDKVMLGWRTAAEAVAAYKRQYDAPGFYGGHTTMAIGRFRRLAFDPKRRGKMIKSRGPMARALASSFRPSTWHELAPDDGARLWKAQAGGQRAGHKYVRRVPKPGGGWRYFYSETSTAHGAREGERINLRDKGLHDVTKVHANGHVTLKHAHTGEEKTVHVSALHADIHSVYRDVATRGAERAVKRLLRQAGHVDVKSGKALWKAYGKRFKALGVPESHAKALLEFVASRRGWEPDAQRVLAEFAARKGGPGRVRSVAQGAEALKAYDGAKQVSPAHVVRAAQVPTGTALDEMRAQVTTALASLETAMGAVDATGGQVKAMNEYAKTVASTPALRSLMEAVHAFPALADLPEYARLRELHGKIHALDGEHKQDDGKGIRGADTTIFVPGKDGKPEGQKARFRLVEASDITPSHDAAAGFKKHANYPEGVQTRTYHSDKEHQQVVRDNAEKIEPLMVVNTNPDAVNGPPIITPDGVVLGGNSRTMSLQLAHKAGGKSAAEYTAHLKKTASSYGFSAKDVEGMKNPVLVREVDTDGADHKVLVQRYNESFTQGMDPRVDQVARGRLVNENMLHTLGVAMAEQSSTGGDRYATLSAFLGSKAAKGFIDAMQTSGVLDRRNKAVYLRKNGTLNEDGKTFVERLLVGKVLPDPDLLSEVMPSQLTAIARSVPHIVRAAGHGHDVTGPLAEALRTAIYMRSAGLKTIDERDDKQHLSEFGARQGMDEASVEAFGKKPEISDLGRAVHKIISEKSGHVAMAGAFRSFAQKAGYNDPRQTDAEREPKGTAHLLAEVLKPPQQALFASYQPFWSRPSWLAKDGGPYIGPRGGKYKDPGHKVAWSENERQRDFVGDEPPEKRRERAQRVKAAVKDVQAAAATYKRAQRLWTASDARKSWQKLYNSLDHLGRALNLDVHHGEDWAEAAAKWMRQRGQRINLGKRAQKVETPKQTSLALSGPFARLLKAASTTDPWIELPEAYGRSLWQASGPFWKGAGHKYIKRVPKPGGGYRYYYHAAHGRGVAHEDHFVEGAKFMHRGGHFHIVAVDGDKLTVVHDETGKRFTVTKEQLTRSLSKKHGKDIEAHKKRMAVPRHIRRLAPQFRAEAQAKWEKEQAAEKAEKEKPAAKPAPTYLSWGWNDAANYKAHPVSVGRILKKDGHIVVVTKTNSSYIRDDGMSFGIGQDRGWHHTATVRPADEDERAIYDAEWNRVEAPRAALRDAQEKTRQAVNDVIEAYRSAGAEQVASMPADAVHVVNTNDRNIKDKKYGSAHNMTVKEDDEHYYSHLYVYDFDQPVMKFRKTAAMDSAIDKMKSAIAENLGAFKVAESAPRTMQAVSKKAAAIQEEPKSVTVQPKDSYEKDMPDPDPPTLADIETALPAGKRATPAQLRGAGFFLARYDERYGDLKAGAHYVRKRGGRFVSYSPAEAHRIALSASMSTPKRAEVNESDPAKHPYLNKQGRRWVVTHPDAYSIKDSIKGAGAKWDRDKRHWYTGNKAIAEKLAVILKGGPFARLLKARRLCA
jgi:DNA (cytosine-5)-methyltransferase 1